MSYEIIYDKQFVKAQENGQEVFFPIIYSGSNNCIQFDRSNRGRRERSWWNWKHPLGGKRYGTLKEMLEFADRERERVIKNNKEQNEKYVKDGQPEWQDEYSDKRWGYFTSLAIGGAQTNRTSFASYKNIFKVGCKKALTVEELKKRHICVTISSYIFKDEDKDAFIKAGKEQFFFTPDSSEELMEKVKFYEEYIKGHKGVSMYVSIDATENQMKYLRQELFPRTKKKRVIVEVEEYFVIKVGNLGYFNRSGRRGNFFYSRWKDEGKVFETEKEAETQLKRLKDRIISYELSVEKVEEKNRILVRR